jgi:RES domain-containing protein
MIVWRICKSKHAGSAFSGAGAERYGGRWNSVGSRMVYTSENLSLATLELFVHVDPSVAPTDLVAIMATLPDEFSKTELEATSLPKNWRTYPSPKLKLSTGARGTISHQRS